MTHKDNMMIKEIYKEAQILAGRGLIPIVQKLGFNENGKKVVLKSMRYKHLVNSDLKAVESYLLKNKDANALGVLMQDRYVNLDFDSIGDHHKFLELGLIQEPERETTRITTTASGKYHYIYELPDGWFDNFNKTTHIGGSDVDVLFGTGNVEYVYPTTLPDGRSYTRNSVVHPTAMPEKLRLFLEPQLASRGTQTTVRSEQSRKDPLDHGELTSRERMLLHELEVWVQGRADCAPHQEQL